MGKINWVRVVSGGVIAAVVIALFGAIVAPRLPETWTTAMTAINSDFPDPTETWPATAILAGSAIQLGIGIVIVWMYAAIRPRYGQGPRTAAIAGFVVWLIVGMQILSLVVLGTFSLRSFVVLHGPYVLGLVLAALAGASVYKEDAAEARSSTTV